MTDELNAEIARQTQVTPDLEPFNRRVGITITEQGHWRKRTFSSPAVHTVEVYCWPADDQANRLVKLAGTCTFSRSAIKLIMRMGFHVYDARDGQRVGEAWFKSVGLQ